jgi:hypothetical protein
MEFPMSLSNIVEIGLSLLTLGAALGLWFYAARHSEPRDVMLVIGSTLAPSGRRTRREREY